MDRITVSFLESERDSAPKPADLSWPELAALLTHHDRRPSNPCRSCGGNGIDFNSIDPCASCEGSGSSHDGKKGPAWVPAVFRAGAARKKDAVESITVAVFDLDERAKGEPITHTDFARIVGDIDAAGVAAVVHSSYRFTAQRPKARVAFRLSRAISPGESIPLRAALETRFGMYADPATKDPGRLYYLPAAAPDALTFGAVTDSEAPIDVDEILKGARAEALTNRANEIANVAVEAAARAAIAAQTAPVDLDLLRRLIRTSRGKHAATLRKIVDGEPFTDRGSRDNDLNALCSAARFAVPPTTPTEALVEIFRASCLTIPADMGEDWVDEARKKFDRHMERRIAHDAARAATIEEVAARMRIEASKAGTIPERIGASMAPTTDAPGSSDVPEPEAAGPVGPYSDEEISTWAREHGCMDQIDFAHRWIITRANSYYLFVEGRYLPPVPRENLEHTLIRDFARAPVQLMEQTERGAIRMRKVANVLHDHSTVARQIEASLSLQRSFYEPASQTFFEAVCPLRRLPPVYHAEVDQWLRLLDPSERLLDWVATVSRLDRQSCAVYLDGPGGVGKSLLAVGLARLWTTGGPSEIARVLEGFNESLIACPLILADEALPQRKGITAELRRLIGSTKRTLNRKFLPAAPLEGAVRLVIAGNNDRLLDSGEELSANDLEAVASRIYYLKAGRDPAAYLESIGGPPRIQRWIDGDAIAQHSLWLKANRHVNEGARFLVEGNASEFHRHLATGAGMAGLVCEWIARYLADSAPQPTPYVQIGSGQLWVNTEALAKQMAWEKYVPSAQVPSAARIGRALRSLSIGSVEVVAEGKSTSFHRIDASLILSWVERLQIGDLSAIRSRVAKFNATIATTVTAPDHGGLEHE